MPTLFMISLGCAKNLVDAETMLGETLGDDFSLAADPSLADIIIINTCGFIQEARDEAREAFEECIALKTSEKQPRRKLKIVATGCWAQRDPQTLLDEFPDLDAVWGLGMASSLADALRALVSASPDSSPIQGIGNDGPVREGVRLVTTLPSFAYLRLADGCDNRCHYCAIPLIRGGMRSRQPEAVLEEARILADQGAQELVLIAQDTTAYGQDLKQPGATLADLLETLLRAVDIPRIRLLYAHPAHIDNRVIDLLRNQPRLCGYLDLPIQHASDRILAAMGRGYGKDRVLEILDRLGSEVTVRSTLLLGYPGETEDDFREALDLVESGRFRHLGAFAYSPEPGTKAFDLPERIPPEVAAQRRDAVMEAQAEVAFTWLDSRIDNTEAVLIDARLDGKWLQGRSSHEAPDADGVVLVQDSRHGPGDIVMACIKERDGYDLIGVIKHPRKKRTPTTFT